MQYVMICAPLPSVCKPVRMREGAGGVSNHNITCKVAAKLCALAPLTGEAKIFLYFFLKKTLHPLR